MKVFEIILPSDIVEFEEHTNAKIYQRATGISQDQKNILIF
jgi:hypothetical protein